MVVSRFAVAITFFYRSDRLRFLATVGDNIRGLGVDCDVFVVTDAHEPQLQDRISEALGVKNIDIIAPDILGHPYLLTWIHREVFRREFVTSDKHSHFLYLEDDIHFSKSNLDYWMEARELLRPHRLIPGFVRFEVNSRGVKYSTDITKPEPLSNLARVRCGSSLFINPVFPYHGMYLMDRELMDEFLCPQFSSPDFGNWGIRERANQGLIFANNLPGCRSRSFVGYEPAKGFHQGALIHHMANNYVIDMTTLHGSFRLDEVVIDDVTKASHPVGQLVTLLNDANKASRQIRDLERKDIELTETQHRNQKLESVVGRRIVRNFLKLVSLLDSLCGRSAFSPVAKIGAKAEKRNN